MTDGDCVILPPLRYKKQTWSCTPSGGTNVIGFEET